MSGQGHFILGFRVPTPSVWAWGKGGEEGAKGSKGNAILGFRAPTTCDNKNFDYHM